MSKKKKKAKARICPCGRITLRERCDRCSAARLAQQAIATAAR